MKIIHLLEYAEYTDIEPLSDENIVAIQRDCSQFINEFLNNDMVVYRGLDNLEPELVHLIPTQKQREVHGTTFNSDFIRASLEKYLSQHDVSRYSHSVSTITFNPMDFEGVGVDNWFLFLPVNGYRYHYYTDVDSGDINVADTMHYKKVAQFGFTMEVMLDTWEHVKQNIDRMDDGDVLEIFKPYSVDAITRFYNKLSSVIEDIKDPFNIESIELKHRVESVVQIADLFMRNVAMDNDVDHILDDLHSVVSHLSKISQTNVFDSVEHIKGSIITNTLPPKGNKYEIVFTCEKYYAFPLHLKSELLERLLK